jgi:Spy/CpxP family protein refolding chaperone
MKRLLTICLLAAFSLAAMAQDKPDFKNPEKRQERFQADKVAFLTQQMDLTVAEAEAFWPVYNEYSKASEETHKAVMAAIGKVHKAAELSDAEVEQAINDLLAAQKAENDLMDQYTAKFKKVLPIKKVAAFFAAEDSFRKHLFRKFKDHERPGKPGKPDPRRADPTRRPDKDKTQK